MMSTIYYQHEHIVPAWFPGEYVSEYTGDVTCCTSFWKAARVLWPWEEAGYWALWLSSDFLGIWLQCWVKLLTASEFGSKCRRADCPIRSCQPRHMTGSQPIRAKLKVQAHISCSTPCAGGTLISTPAEMIDFLCHVTPVPLITWCTAGPPIGRY